VAVGGAIVLGTVVRAPATVPGARLLNAVAAFLGLVVAFYPMYYVFPDLDVSVGDVWPGVVVAALGWVVLEGVFGIYVGFSSKAQHYGLLGTLILLVTWLYLGALVLLLGVSVNATLAGRNQGEPGGARGRRRFGREVTDRESFEHRLDRLVREAGEAGVPKAAVRESTFATLAELRQSRQGYYEQVQEHSDGESTGGPPAES
jgi:membrane protein